MIANTNFFGVDVEFPAIPPEMIPGNVFVLRKILAGQRALRLFYDRLEDCLGGEAQFLARLMHRDWERHFAEILDGAEALLKTLGSGEKEDDVLPTPEQIEKIVALLADATPAKVAEVVHAFVLKAFLASQLVPWFSETREVFECFKMCVEAEDQHMATLDLFVDLLAEKRVETKV